MVSFQEEVPNFYLGTMWSAIVSARFDASPPLQRTRHSV